MTTSSEDVLKMIEFVRVKKADGTLYLMNERIAWMPNGKNTFVISHNYADIKTQKISPEGKPKIQLQVVLANGSDTFHFVNPNGTQRQLEDRNQAKELLQQMLPLFRRKISQEMEQKWKLLMDNPNLYELYKELVTTNIITPEEFWEHYATRKNLTVKQLADSKKEKIGVSSAFLADVKPQADASNGIHYNITSEIIEAIFQTYPAVKKKHFECVPTKLSEEEFWQRFFQSHYFHRDRISSMKDFFHDCAKHDEADIQTAIKKGITDPFFDLRVFDDQAEPTIENVLGPNEMSNKQELSANQALIRRFNFHSIMVLDACRTDEERGYSKDSLLSMIQSSESKKAKKEAEIKSTIEPTEIEFDENLEKERQQSKRRRLLEATEYDDLSGKKPAVGATIDEFDEGVNPPALKVTNANRYMFGPTPSMEHDSYDYANSNGNSNSNQANIVYQQLYQTINSWRPFSKPILESQRAIAALSDLSPGGVLMKDSTSLTANVKDEVPKDVMAELKHLTMALNELLYHFWQCIPFSNAIQEKKFVEMRETLERFEYTKLQPFHDRMSREFHRDLTGHLMNKLHAAYGRYSSWSTKKQYQNRN
ncbi:hypothetical protein RDWZM_006833 [Blomia tropicalis]|uniref:BSD domain-containing protein n=1 Tax=Blomia tropicalis TaxID=40697 RepID=A0A9Q0RPN9_BLOTA|nr:hypothetical protein RDWZM_006833 [Blomia tropicalis]